MRIKNELFALKKTYSYVRFITEQEKRGPNMAERTYYELNPSQEVVTLQLKYSLDKRIINILYSATSDEKLDMSLMKQSLLLAFERHDCMHIVFEKRNGKMMQYFDDNARLQDVPYIEFKTQKEQENFIHKQAKRAINYKHGEVVKFFFCKTYDGKDMIFMKVCHLIIDAYGIGIFFKDLFEIYDALKNNQPLPAPIPKFEDLVKKDIMFKNNEKLKQKNTEFFVDYLSKREEPYYAGFHGNKTKMGQKNFNKKSMNIFFLKNQTDSYLKTISPKVSKRVMDYCMENKISPANFLFYASSLVQSKINSDVKNQLQLELCNCRATASERNCSGTKAQSLGCYVTIEPDITVKENLARFCDNQTLLYRHLGFSDMEFQMLTHKIWKSSYIRTYYANTFSFIPTVKPKGVTMQMYSNEKFPLPLYFATLYDVNTHEMDVIYECQRIIHSAKNIDDFHNNYVYVIEQILNDDQTLVRDIKVKE